jgi:hypothetical protein
MPVHRIMYRQIDAIWLFYLLTALALALFFIGAASHVQVWRKIGQPTSVSGSKKALVNMCKDVFAGRRLLRGDIAAGLMHMAIFWGFFFFFWAPVCWSSMNTSSPSYREKCI